MMAVSPLNNLQTGVAPLGAASDLPRGRFAAATDFAGALDTAQELDAAAQQRARDAANQLVATALVQPILAEVRNSPFKNSMFHGGRGEEVFGQQLDTLLADRIASSPGMGPGAALAERLMGRVGAAGVDVHG